MWLNFNVSTTEKNVNLTKSIQTFLESNVEELGNIFNFETSLANLGRFLWREKKTKVHINLSIGLPIWSPIALGVPLSPSQKFHLVFLLVSNWVPC